MQVMNWQFSPGLWPTLATLIVLPILMSLGFWQLDRAQQKTDIYNNFTERMQAQPTDLSKAFSLRDDKEAMIWRQVIAEGSYQLSTVFLLDNRTLSGKAGYYVYLPFKLTDKSATVLVNYGWVPADTDRNQAPRINLPESLNTQITGLAKAPPSPSPLLKDVPDDTLAEGVYRTQHLDINRVKAQYNLDVLPYVVRLDKGEHPGVYREWTLPGSGSEKHHGYAFQWFAMSAALVIIYLYLNLKRVTNKDE